jgi:DNA-directed RNA polymerase subunit RPC12/RpoP
VPSAGNTTDRGYGHTHQLKRAEYQKVVDAGAGECWRCGKPVNPGDVWHLGHDDIDRNKYRGIECPQCNTKAGGKNGAAVTNAKWAMTVREW